jgi:hypothetical protein
MSDRLISGRFEVGRKEGPGFESSYPPGRGWDADGLVALMEEIFCM